MMNAGIRAGTAFSGLLLIIVAVTLPSQWYFELPLPTNISRFPVTGITLFKAAFVLEGMIVLFLAVAGWKYQLNSRPNRIYQSMPTQKDEPSALFWGVLVIAGFAILLRTIGISQDFWIDEVATLEYAGVSLIDQLTLFVSPNDHLLNTLLIKLSIGLFGESEWSVRLPAILFGVSAIPALYWVTRSSLGGWPALGVTLLLAVSYHHIFFSQNARGYAAYLFLSLLATGLLLRGLKDDKFQIWLLYILVMALNFVALLNSIFVLMAHVTVAFMALLFIEKRGGSCWPYVRRLLFVFLVLGLLVFHFYAIKIPQIYVVLSELYSDPATGFSLFSIEFLHELTRGVSAGFGAGVILAVVPFIVVAMAGFIDLLKKDLLLTLLLLLPGIFTGLYLVTKGLAVSPRFFLFELFLALICAVNGVTVTINWVGRRLRLADDVLFRSSAIIIILLAAISLVSLKKYYYTPKQSYRSAVAYIEHLKTEGSTVIVVFTAGPGIAYYYAKHRNVSDPDEYVYINDYESFSTEIKKAEGKSIYIITTFHRALNIRLPKILNELKEHWLKLEEFPATIGDGSIAIWSSRRSL